MKPSRLSVTVLISFLAAVAAAAAVPQSAPVATRVDAVFSRWNASTPGCAVGVGVKGRPVLERAYGAADLEHGVANRPDTIFEAGSVSKQFTAAAVLLLARDGKLSLDDPARKYVPELPDYGAPLTIRHMLQHTSGLRDWGEVAALAGWPRTSRVHTHDHVLDIVSRQRALNFPPGRQWSYSNTGYNLAAMIVARVSGQSFADFTKARIFAPLGMTRTSWRDDHTRVVPDRAIAYAERAGVFQTNMPFENVHGNGGLLTTVGDLLRWNENAVSPRVGDTAFVREQHEPGRLGDGTAHTYAFGLRIDEYKGVPQVSHSGSTAGYTAHLIRFPDRHLSVAVLCNASSARATAYAEAVADLYLGASIKQTDAAAAANRGRNSAATQPAFAPSREQLAAYAGTYVSDEAEASYTVTLEADGLVLKRRPNTTFKLRPVSEHTFDAGFAEMKFIVDPQGRATELSVRGSRVFDMRFRRVP